MKNFKSYFQKAGSTLLLAFCFYQHTNAQEIQVLSGANSPQDDQNPVWIGDGTLLFTRAYHPGNLGGVTDPGDIWMSKKNEEGKWSEAIHRPDLSTPGYDFPIGLEDILTLLVYHRDEEKHGVYHYSKFGTEWNFLRKLEVEGIEELQGNVTGRISKGGEYIFLSAKRGDSRGNEDIYLVKKNAVIQWERPVHVGNVINTPGQEISPFYDPEKQLLYFSSNMQEGASGKDIFIAKALDESLLNWSQPVKWEQISSPGSEGTVTFISDNEVVWTSTQNSDGFADLLTFKNPEILDIPNDFEAPKTVALSQAKEENSVKVQEIAPIYPSSSVGVPEITIQEKSIQVVENPLQWLVIDQKNKTRILDFTLQGKKEDSWVNLVLDSLKLSEVKNAGVSELRFESAGFFPNSIAAGSILSDEPNVVLLAKAEAGTSLTLEKVSFKRGTSELEGQHTFEYLDEIAEFLKKNEGFKIRINGHTDSAGDPGLNKALSLERAGAVRDYLVENGIGFERLRISGWGGTRPVASNATEAGRSKNRRVDLTVEN
ncbi:OmpA family protein [Algoriphagus vanfongensis]|uniref:OmpA family protein n=1 Tax=Algoriphagus vanfongensis TaxID=426371 RepID=UPI0003FBEFF6|nr:OmpA family protein [Algoriphagus vanfongensis]